MQWNARLAFLTGHDEMFEELSRLVKHTGIYGVGLILSKCVGFLMIPIYTRYLLPRDYGVLELLDMTIFWVSTLAAMGIYQAVFRFYAAYESDREKKEVISTAFLYVVAISVVMTIMMVLLASPIAGAVLGSSAYAPFVRVVAVTLLLSNTADVPLAYWRAQGRSGLFVGVGFIRSIVGALSILIALVVLHRGVAGVIYANLATNALCAVAFSAIIFASMPCRAARDKLIPMLKYGSPLVVQSLASFVLVFSDRFFLRHFAGLSNVGVYSLGYKLAGIVMLLVNSPFGLTWAWQQFELAKKENAQSFYAKIQLYQFLLAMAVGLAVSVFAKDVLRIMTPASYWAAARYVPLIALSYIISNVRSVVLSGILVKRVTHRLVVISIVAAAANLLLNFLLIPKYFAMGAAIATVLSYALYVLLTYVVAQQVYFIQYEYTRNALILGVATLIYLVSTVFDLRLVPSILMNALLLALFAWIAIRILHQEERAMFRKLGLNIAQRLVGTVVSTSRTALGA